MDALKPREQRCETCRFWFSFLDDGWGKCHRFPPVRVSYETVWPKPQDYDWCGEWSAVPADQAEARRRAISWREERRLERMEAQG